MPRSSPPTRAHTAKTLGEAAALWDALLAEALRADPACKPEWKHYASLNGWRCLLRSGKRTLAHLRPDEGAFLASFALDDAALNSAVSLGVPAELVESARKEKKAPEGWPIKVHVASAKDLKVAAALLRARLG